MNSTPPSETPFMRVHDDWILTPYRLAIHAPTETAVVADLHLGYREARQDAGDAIPVLSVAHQLANLRAARRQFEFGDLLVAGDLFERRLRDDLLDEFLAFLQSLGVGFAGLVPGNHDRGWRNFARRLPIHAEGCFLGDWRVAHGDEPVAGGRRVVGHWHPVARRGRRRLPCYVVDNQELVLPAFTQDAAGVDVATARRWTQARFFAIDGPRVIELPGSE